MYLDHFELNEHPFRLTPDADFLYLSPKHARAKACIEQASVTPGAIVIVTGEVGCGKSVLVNRVIAEMPKTVAVARITQTHLEVDEFLQSLLAQFGFKPFDRRKEALRSLLDNFLFAQSVREQGVLLIIEEAQNLSRALLRELAALADIEEDDKKLMSVVLVGQPLLNERLNESELKRIVVRAHCKVHLGPLDRRDTARLIEHRLARAGCAESPFDDEALDAIYRHTGGVPRLVVNLCDTAMTAAFVDEQRRVTPELLAAAIEELELEAVAGTAAPPTATDNDEAEQTGGADDALNQRAVLKISLKGKPLQDCEICDTRVLIGRDTGNDIVLYGEFISRHHAQIMLDPDGAFWVMDLKSTNGVYVNRRRIQRRRLYDGDLIQLGHHEVLYSRAGDVEHGTRAELSDYRDTTVLPEGAAPEAGADASDDTGKVLQAGSDATKKDGTPDASKRIQSSRGHS